MDETEAIIERVRRVTTDFQQLELAIDPLLRKIKPGQSLLVRAQATGWHPYLREQWWPVSIRGDKLLIERPIEQPYESGQVVNVIGPVGQPYRFRRTLRNVLLLAYDTPPIPLLMTIPWLLGNNIGVTLVLLGQARAYTTQHINPEVEIIQGDENIVWENQVMTVGWADQVFAVVAPDDELGRFKRLLERFHELRAEVPQNYLFAVFQPIICCGTGACYSCLLPMRKGAQLICVEGPAFDLTQVVLP